MRPLRFAGPAALLFAIGAAVGCTPPPLAGPTSGVRLDSISPQSPVSSDVSLLMTFRGDGFETGLSLQVSDPTGIRSQVTGTNIQDLTGTSFQAVVVLNVPGVYTFTVLNPDGTVSQPYQLQVSNNGPSGPTITGVVPGSLTRGSFPVLVLITGTGFDLSTVVVLTDPQGLVTTFDSGSISISPPGSIQFSAVFNKSGNYLVAVQNSSGESNVSLITVH